MSSWRTFYIAPRGVARPPGFYAPSRETAFARAREYWGTDALVLHGSSSRRGRFLPR